MFETSHLYIGPVKPGVVTRLEFPYKNLHIVHMQASCGCSIPINDAQKEVIYVDYEAQPVPPHLVAQGKDEYTTSKTIAVKYVDKDNPNTPEGTMFTQLHTLIFNANIKK